MRAAPLLLLVLLLGACTTPTSTDGALTTAASPPATDPGTTPPAPDDEPDGPALGAAPDAPPTGPAPGATPRDGGPASPQGVQSCDRGTAGEVDKVIGAQLTAFADGDFAGALQLATPSFRAGFDVESFQEMIQSQFPVPATATDHEVLTCDVLQAVAAATVEVTGQPGSQTLQYLLEQVDGAWRIAGAVPTTPDAVPPAGGDQVI